MDSCQPNQTLILKYFLLLSLSLLLLLYARLKPFMEKHKAMNQNGFNREINLVRKKGIKEEN